MGVLHLKRWTMIQHKIATNVGANPFAQSKAQDCFGAIISTQTSCDVSFVGIQYCIVFLITFPLFFEHRRLCLIYLWTKICFSCFIHPIWIQRYAFVVHVTDWYIGRNYVCTLRLSIYFDLFFPNWNFWNTHIDLCGNRQKTWSNRC